MRWFTNSTLYEVDNQQVEVDSPLMCNILTLLNVGPFYTPAAATSTSTTANFYLMEDSTSYYLLEDGTSKYLLEDS